MNGSATTSTTPAGWFVYVLRCADGSLYTGITNDLGRRLLAHGAGKASKYTRSRRPVRVMCTMGPWRTRGRALSEEARIKAMPREEKLALIRSYARAIRARR